MQQRSVRRCLLFKQLMFDGSVGCGDRVAHHAMTCDDASFANCLGLPVAHSVPMASVSDSGSCSPVSELAPTITAPTGNTGYNLFYARVHRWAQRAGGATWRVWKKLGLKRVPGCPLAPERVRLLKPWMKADAHAPCMCIALRRVLFPATFVAFPLIAHRVVREYLV